VPLASPSPSLADLGWDEGWAQALAATPDPLLTPGRISRIDRGLCTVLTATGPQRVSTVSDVAVAVGDWVTVSPESAPGTQRQLAALLPRRCAFRRTTDDPAARESVVAANIDTVLLVDAIDGNLSARHLERYLALSWQSGATPVVLITKADLASTERVLEWVTAVEAVALGVAVHVVSAVTGQGIEKLGPYLAPGRTVALLGLSGAGKSTLVNLLAGAEILTTGRVRSDGQGRHNTTHRELVPLPGGGLLIDTPGMRALSVVGAQAGVARAFDDVERLADACEFADCSHTNEPGCAILAAVATGLLSGERLESWRRLREQPHQPDHETVRLQVEDRKRRKATDKVARARARALARE